MSKESLYYENLTTYQRRIAEDYLLSMYHFNVEIAEDQNHIRESAPQYMREYVKNVLADKIVDKMQHTSEHNPIRRSFVHRYSVKLPSDNVLLSLRKFYE